MLITAPAGGAGHLAVQIAKASGASVIGMTVPDAEGHVRSLGADEVIDYTTTEFAGRLFVEADRLVYRVMRAIVRVVHDIQRRLSMQTTELTNYLYKTHGRY